MTKERERELCPEHFFALISVCAEQCLRLHPVYARRAIQHRLKRIEGALDVLAGMFGKLR